MRPNHPDALMLGALTAKLTREYSRAGYLLDRLLARHTNLIPAIYLSGDVMLLADQPAKALRQLSRAFELEFRIAAGSDHASLLAQLVEFGMCAPAAVVLGREPQLNMVGRCLEQLHADAQDLMPAIRSLGQQNYTARLGDEYRARLEIACAVLGFHRSASPHRNKLLFEWVLLPWMKHAMAADQFETSLALEHIVYGAYISQTESTTFFSGEIAKWRDPMREAGRRFARALPPPPKPRKTAPGRPQLLFFVHVLNRLAHVRQLLEVIDAISGLQLRPFDAVIVTLKIEDQELASRIRSAGLSLIEIRPEGTMPVSQALHRLRDEAHSRNAAAVVWISLVDLMCFAFGMRLAGTQVWWAMKYHGLRFPEIDGYLTGGSIAGGLKRIDGHEWRVGPVLATDLVETGTDSEVAAIRARYPATQVLFGCFGREEKLTDTAFLDAICEILARIPDGAFLWTGRTQHPDIQRAFESKGVAERCHFIGWVNTRQYARVIDIFLDSFPFPCGYTLYEAMAVGRPVVLYASPESEQTGLHAIVSPLLFGADGCNEDRAELRAIFQHAQHGNLYLRADNPGKYVDFAIRLADDTSFRTQAGEACRHFVDRFMLNRERTGRIYAQHFMDILAGQAMGGREEGNPPLS